MADSIQNASDGELLRMVEQLKTALAENPAHYPSISAGIRTELDTLGDLYRDKLAAHKAAQAAAKAAVTDKDIVKRKIRALMRNVRNINKATGVDEAKMKMLGIPALANNAPAKATVPVGAVDTSERLRHTISWKDLEADSKKRPRGSMGAEIWIKIGDPAPGDEKHCRFLTLNASAPYIAEHDPADAGKTAHYMLRWRIRDGSVTAWGETISATITG